MPSPLRSFLSDAFPTIKADPQACWVSNILSRDIPEQLEPLSPAIKIVDRCNQLTMLKQRASQEHPVDRPHTQQYDDRFLDCLTEACAFAWAVLKKLGTPEFHYREGAPDIYVNPGIWIEAKTIHPSLEDKELRERVFKKGEVAGVTVPISYEGLFRKFEYDFKDAKGKFKRQGTGKNIAFFNLAQLDVSAWLEKKEYILAKLDQWANSKKSSKPTIYIVICYNYNWQGPFRDLSLSDIG